jgi:hypothetical protein
MDKRLDEINRAVDEVMMLNDLHNEISIFIDIDLQMKSIAIIDEFNRWNTGEGKIKDKTDRNEFFKDSIIIFSKLLERYNFMLNNLRNSENKAVYWKYKYESVVSFAKKEEMYWEKFRILADRLEELENERN